MTFELWPSETVCVCVCEWGREEGTETKGQKRRREEQTAYVLFVIPLTMWDSKWLFLQRAWESVFVSSCIHSTAALTCTEARCPFLNHYHIRTPRTVPIYIQASEEYAIVVAEHLFVAFKYFTSGVTLRTMTEGHYYIEHAESLLEWLCSPRSNQMM